MNPTKVNIQHLFEGNDTFDVPKFQRGYAWEERSIDDFIRDLSMCLKSRIAGGRRQHFFGCIVTVERTVERSLRHNHEVIDGQQRLASFIMLVAAIKHGIENLVNELENKPKLTEEEERTKEFFRETSSMLYDTYLSYEDKINPKPKKESKLTLSATDDEFFQNKIRFKTTGQERASHKRIDDAWEKLKEYVDKDLLKEGTSIGTKNKLKLFIHNVLAKDCSVILIRSNNDSEAYQIFQVINDRGVQLTDGDLLRARTMQLMEAEELDAMQKKLSEKWDRILSYPSEDIENYLCWYYSSREGVSLIKSKKIKISDKFLEFRFKCKDKVTLDKQAAELILTETEKIEADFSTLSKLGRGEWPYAHKKVENWDSERLRMLVTHLGHTHVMPLLLSLQTLDQKKFAEAISTLERFFFRFKIIGQTHINPMTKVYFDHAKKIREEGSSYSISQLRKELFNLINESINDKSFASKLRELIYLKKGSKNKGKNAYIRYFLITLEDHIKWYDGGKAPGTPKCKDKTRVFDFSNTTLEHVYPRSVKGDETDKALEACKHTIGNLTILDPDENNSLANKPVKDKLPIFKNSNIGLNRDIAKNSEWTEKEVKKRTEDLIKMALKVFVP